MCFNNMKHNMKMLIPKTINSITITIFFFAWQIVIGTFVCMKLTSPNSTLRCVSVIKIFLCNGNLSHCTLYIQIHLYSIKKNNTCREKI